MLDRFRIFWTNVIRPVANLLMRMGVTPDMVTIVGTVGVVGGALVKGASAQGPHPVEGAVAFTGEHQAGIVTPAQDRLHFVAFDVITKDRERLVATGE